MTFRLACEHFTVIAFLFRVHVKNHRVCILSLDTIGHGVMWQRIRLHSHILHVCMGLTSIFNVLQIQNNQWGYDSQNVNNQLQIYQWLSSDSNLHPL